MDATIERIDGQPFGRCYKIEADGVVHYLPSVTTILKMLPDPYLDRLQTELGPEKFALVTRRASDRGTVMHKWLEEFYDHYGRHQDPEAAVVHTQEYIKKWSDTFVPETDKARALKIGRELFYNFYTRSCYKKIKAVLHNEIFMYTFFRTGWAGASDFIFEDVDDLLVVQDFKSSSDMKDPDNIPKYKLQIAAYMFSYAGMYGRVPDRGEILISNEKCDVIQTIIVPKSELKMYMDQFLDLLKKFKQTPEWLEFERKVSDGLVLTAN
jgi:hypothetical protein